jgi:hypothetical protein
MRLPRGARTPLLVGLTSLSALCAAASTTHAQDAGGAAIVTARDPRLAETEAFLEGTLDVAVDPRGLFDVALGDEAAVRIEAVRIRALLIALEADASTGDASLAEADVDAIDAVRWSDRVSLDRARLEVYALPAERRVGLLRAHAARQAATQPRESAEERRARIAEAERQQALEAARVARTEAERLVAEEQARLIHVRTRVASLGVRLADERAALEARKDLVLGWQRRGRDAEVGPPAGADALYDALRRRLRESRDDLDRALVSLDAMASAVPALGPDPMADVPPDVPTEQVRARRRAVERAIRDARAEEQALRDARAATLLDEIDALNRERLGLLPHLSAEKRAAITGFSEAGWDQARSEARQLTLILRYHRHRVARWAGSLREGGPSGLSPWKATAVAVPWALFVYAFAWWTRRSSRLLALATKRVAAVDRAERRVAPSPLQAALRIATAVHRPLEDLVFLAATLWLLPSTVRALLEVQLVANVVGWTLGGALVVNAINALAAGPTTLVSAEKEGLAELRLRSLQLVGRVTVAFVLVLVLSGRLVGEGTLYSWVLSTCWLASVPVFLLLVRWWRERVFERVDRARKKTPVQAWVLANRHGWQSFLAAMAGAVQLFASGAVKTLRNWLGRFDLARRAHAYVFKRELDRLAGGRPSSETRPLRAELREALSPDSAHGAWVASPTDDLLASLAQRVHEGRGGVVALVGGRGAGKSSLLRQLAERIEDAVTLDGITHATADLMRDALGPAAPRLVLLDDAQALIRPFIAGLRTFDEVFALARSQGPTTLWVFAIDSALWAFLHRARDARPLFDTVTHLAPWSEEQIGEFLAHRSALAGAEPTFEDLLDRLPPSADEIDRQDALRDRRAGYMRMLWDHVRGNAGMALEVWRSSLVEGADGTVRVRPLQVPDATEIEALPDASLFILRAVLQLTPARAPDVARMTRLTEEQVRNAFRLGEARGYFTEVDGGVRITWRWLRPIIHLLERRHLLVNP